MSAVSELEQVVKRAKDDTTFATRLEDNPAEVLKNVLGTPAYVSDPVIYRYVVWFLGLVLLVAAGGAIVAMFVKNGDVPAALVAFGSGALGALGGLLAPSPVEKQQQQRP